MTQYVYLVVGARNSPGRVFAVFADEEAALDFRDHYHSDEADVERRTLLCGQHISATGYID